MQGAFIFAACAHQLITFVVPCKRSQTSRHGHQDGRYPSQVSIAASTRTITAAHRTC